MTRRIRHAGWLVGMGLAAAFGTLTGTVPGAAGFDATAGDPGSATSLEVPSPTTSTTDDLVSSTPVPGPTTTPGVTTDPMATSPSDGQGDDRRGSPTSGRPADGPTDVREPDPAVGSGHPGDDPAGQSTAVPSVDPMAASAAGAVVPTGAPRAAANTAAVPAPATAEVTGEPTAGAAPTADPASPPAAPAPTVDLHRGAGQRMAFLVGLDQGVLLAGIAVALAASVGAGALMGRSRRGWAHRLPRPPARP